MVVDVKLPGLLRRVRVMAIDARSVPVILEALHFLFAVLVASRRKRWPVLATSANILGTAGVRLVPPLWHEMQFCCRVHIRITGIGLLSNVGRPEHVRCMAGEARIPDSPCYRARPWRSCLACERPTHECSAASK